MDTDSNQSKHPAMYISISELARTSDSGSNSTKMVRVIGKLASYDVSSSRLLIQDCIFPSNTLLLDTSRIEPFTHRANWLCLFIGELDTENIEGTETLVLKVLLYRCVNQLSTETHNKAHSLRMVSLHTV